MTQIILAFFLLVVTACSEKDYVPEVPKTPDPLTATDVYLYADLLREHSGFEDYFKDPKLIAITEEYGPTLVDLKQLPYESKIFEAKTKPWSSWWFPKKDSYLFEDTTQKSPLTKYDLYRIDKQSSASSASKFERNSYNSSALAWEGLCDAWALASIYHREPKRTVSFKLGSFLNRSQIHFDVSDLKALLLKTYEAIDDSQLSFFGQKFTGQADGWIHPDLFPEQFHRFLEIQLMTKKQAFIMDHDPGVEIWNIPSFKANYKMTAMPNNPNSVYVRMWVYSAEPVKKDEKSFVGTREAVREFNYVLVGEVNEQQQLTVKSGYWVKGPSGIDSRKSHPDYVLYAKQELARKSHNPEIITEIVDQILTESY